MVWTITIGEEALGYLNNFYFWVTEINDVTLNSDVNYFQQNKQKALTVF